MIHNAHLVLAQKRIAAGREWRPEYDGWLFLRISSGDGYLLHKTATRQLSTGDVVVLNGRFAADIRASQLTDVESHYFQVIPARLTGILTTVEYEWLEKRAGEAVHLPAADPTARQFAAMLKSQSAKENPLLQRWQMLHLAVPHMANSIPLVASPPTQNCITARERFRELIGRIPASELERQSAEELARQCGCSERHFSRLFREHFGHSLVPRKIELRLQKASVLLQETDSKIIDVAMESGFQHVGQFTQHFRKHFGVTPGEWRIRRRKACRN